MTRNGVFQVKDKNIKRAFNKIKADEHVKQNMLAKVMSQRDKIQARRLRKNILVPIMIFMLVIVSIAGYIYIRNHNGMGLTNNLAGQGGSGTGNMPVETEDAVEEIRDEFELDDKQYVILSAEKTTKFGLPSDISGHDIGDKLTTIKTSVDERLIGKNVYHYLPAGSEAVVVVETTEGNKLFGFYNFTSYNQNQDEDARAYLELYGIYEASDIDKIQFIDDGEMTDQENITRFYDYYSVLKNSSREYFDSLSKGKHLGNGNEIDPPKNSGTRGEQSTPSYEGTGPNALENSVQIRIYNQSGVYYETVYYPNINFISRHQVDKNFANFLASYIN